MGISFLYEDFLYEVPHSEKKIIWFEKKFLGGFDRSQWDQPKTGLILMYPRVGKIYKTTKADLGYICIRLIVGVRASVGLPCGMRRPPRAEGVYQRKIAVNRCRMPQVHGPLKKNPTTEKLIFRHLQKRGHPLSMKQEKNQFFHRWHFFYAGRPRSPWGRRCAFISPERSLNYYYPLPYR